MLADPDNGAQIDLGVACLLEQFTAGGVFQGLALVDPAADRAPPAARAGGLVLEPHEQQPAGRREQQQPDRQPFAGLRGQTVRWARSFSLVDLIMSFTACHWSSPHSVMREKLPPLALYWPPSMAMVWPFTYSEPFDSR